MDKKILKILVLTSRGKGTGGQQISPTEIYTVQGKTNVTVVGYASYLSISGDLSNLKTIKEDFQENGWLDSETRISSEKTIFNFADDEYILNASKILVEAGYDVTTDMNIAFPENIGDITTNGPQFKIKTTPLYTIGDTLTIQFAGYVQNNRLLDEYPIQYDLVAYSSTLSLEAEVTEIKSTEFELFLEDEEKQTIIEEKYNTSFENSTTSFDVEDADNEYEYLINELEDTDYTIEIDQTLGVKLMPSPTQGVYDSTTFVVHTDDLHNEGDILNVQIDAVLYKGSIQRIIDYEVLEE